MLKPLLLAFFLFLTLSASAQCRDPFINQAYQQVAGRKPVGTGDACECNKNLYNGGTWGTLNELVGYVRQVTQTGLRFGYAPVGNNNVLAVAQGSQIIAVSLFDQGGNLVASGGGNLVASGGGNLVASGGGNLVASGGGNLTGLSANTPGFSFGGNYGTLSVGQRRVNTNGKGALVIK
ncbi:MAG: hypothetical protein ACRYFX_22915 [Janthinobacterium lividum]